MTCKFKYGDRVIVGEHTGKVVSIAKDYIHYICTVRFDNENLIPREMIYEECQLKMIGEENKKEEKKCNCGVTITYGKVPIESHSNYCDLRKETQQDLYEPIIEDEDEDDFGTYWP